MRRRRRRVLVVAMVTVLVAVVAVGWVTRDRVERVVSGAPPEGDGVFLSAKEGAATADFRTKAGKDVVFGGNVLRNKGSHVLKLTTGRLVGDVPGSAARLVEVRAILMGTRDRELVGAGPWPFENYQERSRRVAGFTLAAHRDAEILYVVHASKPGAWHWKRTEVRYTSGGHDYAAQTDFGFMVCVPASSSC